MISVQIDLIKWGIFDPEPLKHLKIWNDGTGDESNGNYKYKISSSNGKVYREGEVEGFKRKSKDVLDLLSIILEQENYGNRSKSDIDSQNGDL